MPERRHTSNASLDSPVSSRWPASGAVSPRFTGYWEHGPSDSSRMPATRRGSIAFDESASHRGSYDHSMFVNDDLMEDSQIGSLHIHDRRPSVSEDLHMRAGAKRRASSPPRDGLREERSSVDSASGHSEIYQRRSVQQLSTRASPVSRFHPNHSSVSSASSLGPRNGSLGSSLGLGSIPSSATSYASGRLSPNPLSPATESDPRQSMPYGSTKVLSTNHQRTCSDNLQSGRKHSSDSTSHSRHSSVSHMQSIHICECCPKKPKKYDTEDELR